MNKNNIGGTAGINWKPLSYNVDVGFKYIFHNSATLVGERNIPFLKKGKNNHEIAFTLSFRL